MFFSLVACVIGEYSSWSFSALILMWGGMCLVVAFLFLGGFLIVHAVVVAVNWLDNLMETNPPQEP